MSRRGRAGLPSDDVLLQALDLLVETEGIVKAADRLGVTYRTASGCYESRHVSRKMRGVLGKHLRQQTEQTERSAQAEQSGQAEEQVALAAATEPDEPEANQTGDVEESPLQEPDQALRRQVEALRTEVVDLRERLAAVEGRIARGRGNRSDKVGVEGPDTKGDDKQQRSVAPPRRIFPELITEVAEPGEEQVYGAAAELVVEWRDAWGERRSAYYTLDWLRAERRRLDLELRLIGVFGLTPPPADAPWRERRRDEEVDWRRRALWRLRWQLPVTWGLHWMLRALTLGLWGRPAR